ncbi:interleukin-7 receptor subunit alpha [Pempheris klunzingeri]|uniref:interleukin-7 receptor subunit alpha n=1 Tax=Pempheris klunzingeri TaxID=3127111 RepID=UPI00397EBE67
MPSCWWLAVLLLPAVTEAQSGDGDAEMEPRICCTSHITTDRRDHNSLTCELVGGTIDNEDDEDDEDDGIEKMRMCYTADWDSKTVKCLEDFGDTISSRDLDPVVNYNVTIFLKRGGKISTTVDLTKIVKPRPPQVCNVTFNQKSNQALIHIRTPYHKEYLKVENQLFQLLVWTAGREMVQNISASETMNIDMQHLQKNTEYHVKVRAIPQMYLQGSWSEWSGQFSFSVPTEDKVQKMTYKLIGCLVLLLAVPSTAVFFWKIKIFTYMWPSIPHPKHTLVHICKPNKGLLLNFKPEVFSALKVCPAEKPEEQRSAAAGPQSDPVCSTQSSGGSTSTTSVSTEELELSALLSRSSSDGEDGLQSTSPSPIHVLRLGEGPHAPQAELGAGGREVEACGVNQPEEAYVTMSSFYQIK